MNRWGPARWPDWDLPPTLTPGLDRATLQPRSRAVAMAG